MRDKTSSTDRLEAWVDGSAICLIAVSSHGDPLDLGEGEAEALIRKLQRCVDESKSGTEREGRRAGTHPNEGAEDQAACCFCAESVPMGKAISIGLEFPGHPSEVQGLYAHPRCIQVALHRSIPLHPGTDSPQVESSQE